MTTFRMVRDYSVHGSVDRAYRVETSQLLTAQEAQKLMADLGSRYGSKPQEHEIGLLQPATVSASGKLVVGDVTFQNPAWFPRLYAEVGTWHD